MNAPNIIHSPSDAGQGEFFRSESDKFKRKGCSVWQGKGIARRKGSNTKEFRHNFDRIFGHGNTVSYFEKYG